MLYAMLQEDQHKSSGAKADNIMLMKLTPEAGGLGADLALVRSGRVEAQVCQYDLLLRGLRFLERRKPVFNRVMPL